MSLNNSRVCYSIKACWDIAVSILRNYWLLFYFFPLLLFFVTLIPGVGNWGLALIISSPAWEFSFFCSFSFPRLMSEYIYSYFQ